MHNYITPDGRMKFWLMSPLNDLRYAYLTLDDYLLRVKQNVERYRAAGLKVAFTEMTCGIDLMDRATNMPLDLTTAARTGGIRQAPAVAGKILHRVIKDRHEL